MKRKKTAEDEPVIPKQIIENAKASLITDSVQPAKAEPCVVCRLKISAWHDSEQMPAQE